MLHKLAIFTSQFPGKVNTFFARDIVALINCGLSLDIFPVYPIQEKYWKFVPENLKDTIQQGTKIIYLSPVNFTENKSSLTKDIDNILKQSKKLGLKQYLKSKYVIRQAALWQKYFDGQYDYMLSYWGNYAATYGYLANKALKNDIPFSFILHAGTDLYRDQIYLEEKIKYATKVFTVCEFNKRFLKNLYPHSYKTFREKLILHHLGMDFDDFHFQINGREEYTLLTIGSLVPQKGFLYVVKALALLTSDIPTLKLVMIGDGPERRKLERIASRLKVKDRIVFTGIMPFKEVKNYLQKCSILVHPSNGLGDAVPTVIKEALASGLPVIASDIVGIPELLEYGKSGILVPPRDDKTLATAINMLLKNREKREQLANNGRLYAEKHFNVWENVKKLYNLLELDSNI